MLPQPFQVEGIIVSDLPALASAMACLIRADIDPEQLPLPLRYIFETCLMLKLFNHDLVSGALGAPSSTIAISGSSLARMGAKTPFTVSKNDDMV